jgi:carbonic anhydrase/acetyltransferase-like protein (isoleucine patch superfamily)
MRVLRRALRIFKREIESLLSERIAFLRAVRRSEGRIAWRAVVQVDRESTVLVGAGSRVGIGTVLAARSDQTGPASIRIGRRTYVGEYNNLRADGSEIAIGDHCLISQFVSLISSGHEFLDRSRLIEEQGIPEKKGIRIGDDVWIGAMVTVLPGISIGTGAVVGSGAVVTRDIPPYAIAIGNPARVVGERT